MYPSSYCYDYYWAPLLFHGEMEFGLTWIHLLAPAFGLMPLACLAWFVW